jgi:hypothetical protein
MLRLALEFRASARHSQTVYQGSKRWPQVKVESALTMPTSTSHLPRIRRERNRTGSGDVDKNGSGGYGSLSTAVRAGW